MDEKPGADLEDLLPPGMREKDFRAAVDLSGYPLQTVVAGSLADREYRIEEEWAWRDPESDAERALDILAERSNGSWHRSEKGRVQVVRSLLIECKQSRNPYLGFAAVSPPPIDRHPHIVGLRHPEVLIESDIGSHGRYFPLLHVLGLRSHPYLRNPLVVSSLSRAHGNGRVQMSGDEPFNSLVRPLTKAAATFRSHWRSPGGYGNEDSLVVRLVFPIAVIDGPLFAVRGRRGASEITPIEWMRIFTRHAAGGERRPRSRLGFDVVDLIAADYFETFLKEHLEPFVDDLISSLSLIQDCVLAGRAVLPGYLPDKPLPFNWLKALRPG